MMMDTPSPVEAALLRLESLHPKLIDLGLDRGLALLSKLGNPHLSLPPVIHIAGTNGKGSCLAFMRSIFEAAGLCCHVYSSPHLVRFNERIRLAGRLVDDGYLADLLTEVEAVNNGDDITFFEITTAAALLAYNRVKADAVLLETGLGGRLDSTNVIPNPALTMITPIAHDHEHFLGGTLAEIAFEKAGIMRSGTLCISASQDSEVMETLQSHASDIGADLLFAGRDFAIESHDEICGGGVRAEYNNRQITVPQLGLLGNHQRENAGLAIAGVMATRPDITDDAIIAGAADASWPGRIQELTHGKLMIDRTPPKVQVFLDGAHNAHGSKALASALAAMNAGSSIAGGEGGWILICGALSTRPAADFLAPLKPLVRRAITMTIPHQAAALSGEDLSAAAADLGIATEAAPSLIAAMDRAFEIAQSMGCNIIISGSLYLAGHVLEQNETLPD